MVCDFKVRRLSTKELLNVEAIVRFGAIQWLLAYGLMLWKGFRLRICPWPIVLGSYSLIWEFVDGCLDYFNKDSLKTKHTAMDGALEFVHGQLYLGYTVSYGNVLQRGCCTWYGFSLILVYIFSSFSMNWENRLDLQIQKKQS